MRITEKQKRISIFMAVIGLLIFFHGLGFLRPVENFALKMLSPILKDIYVFGIGFQDKLNDQVTKKDLIQENENLKSKIVNNIIVEAEFKLLQEENKILRDSLGFLSRNEYRAVMANVISRGEIGDIYGQPEAIIIDQGNESGVYEGLAVVDSRGTVVGKVAEVKDSTSLIYLTNNSKCKFAATILNDERTSGITEGELGLTITMKYIPQNRVIAVNDIVVTSGLEEGVKRGLVIGRIRDINKENNDLWQEAEIESLVSPDNLVVVSVIIP